MLKKFILGLLAVGFVSGVSVESQAQSPFEFSYGYSLGIQNSFRHRLPAPPYFAVFPPVYYGQRYERPYGESPFASWPLLQPNEDYRPVRASQRFVPPVMVENPYVIEDYYYQSMRSDLPKVSPSPKKASASAVLQSETDSNSIVLNDSMGPNVVRPSSVNPVGVQPVVVVNPFVKELFVSK